MPKDAWGRENARIKAKKARLEYATGEPPSFERLSDEVIPLDQISWRKPGASSSKIVSSESSSEPPKPVTKPQTRGHTISQKPPPATKANIIRCVVAHGVSVVIEHDGISKMTTVQALEQALVHVKKEVVISSSTLPAKPTWQSVSKKTQFKAAPSLEPPKGVESGKLTKSQPSATGLDQLRLELVDIARTLVAMNALPAIWKEKAIHTWLKNVEKAAKPMKLASLILELGASTCDRSRLSLSFRKGWKEWRKTCLTAKTFRDVEGLVAKFRDALL